MLKGVWVLNNLMAVLPKGVQVIFYPQILGLLCWPLSCHPKSFLPYQPNLRNFEKKTHISRCRRTQGQQFSIQQPLTTIVSSGLSSGFLQVLIGMLVTCGRLRSVTSLEVSISEQVKFSENPSLSTAINEHFFHSKKHQHMCLYFCIIHLDSFTQQRRLNKKQNERRRY